MKNMPPAALQGPMAQQQKIMLYMLPLIFAFSGVNFPIGVLIYWTTTNIWSMGQQFYTIRRMPAPGSEAEKAYKARQARKAAARGQVIEDAAPAVVIEEKPRGQRQQPKRKDRAKARPQVDGPVDAKATDAEPVDAPVEDAPVSPPSAATTPTDGPKKKRKGSSSKSTDGPTIP